MSDETPAEQFAQLVAIMVERSEETFGPDETQGARRMFGSTSIKTGGKMFAFLNKERLIVKLPTQRVAELVAAGQAEPYDVGNGRIQREWVAVASESLDDWIAIATEAESFVARGRKK